MQFAMISDDNYVKRIRRMIAKSEKNRRYDLTLTWTMLGFLIAAYISMSIPVHDAVSKMPTGPRVVMVVAYASFFFTVLISGPIWKLTSLIRGPSRAHRLLIAYHDELAAQKGEPGPRRRN